MIIDETELAEAQPFQADGGDSKAEHSAATETKSAGSSAAVNSNPPVPGYWAGFESGFCGFFEAINPASCSQASQDDCCSLFGECFTGVRTFFCRPRAEQRPMLPVSDFRKGQQCGNCCAPICICASVVGICAGMALGGCFSGGGTGPGPRLPTPTLK